MQMKSKSLITTDANGTSNSKAKRISRRLPTHRPPTHPGEMLMEEFLKTLELPILSYLNDTQLYVHCASDGHSVFDVAPWRAERELEQWRPIARWLSRHIVEPA